MQVQPHVPGKGHRQGQHPDNAQHRQNPAQLRGSTTGQPHQVGGGGDSDQDEETRFDRGDVSLRKCNILINLGLIVQNVVLNFVTLNHLQTLMLLHFASLSVGYKIR